MALPLDIRDLLTSGSKLRTEREKELRLAVYIDTEAPEAAVEAFRSALRPQMSTARLHIEPVVPGDVLVVDGTADAVIALVGNGSTLAPSLARARDGFIPTLVLSLGGERDSVAARLGHPVLDTICANQPDELVSQAGGWLADRLSAKRLALAANFAFVRHAVSVESIKSTAFQNAVVGGVMIIPGADMPIMTANQAKMLMQIAAAYGEPLGAERIKELAAVVGGAFVMRTVARQVLTLVPGFGWAIKAGIGYSGTLAMGYAALEYFENGGDVRGLAEKVKGARDRAIDAAKTRGKRRPEQPIPAHAWVAESPPPPRPEPALPPVGGYYELPPEEAGKQ